MRIDVKDLVVRYGDQVAVNGVSFTVGRGEHRDPARPLGLRQDHDVARHRRPGAADAAASIRIDGQTMYDAAVRKNVPTEQRGVSMVFQSYAVWPHMTVFDNVAYGLRVRKQNTADIKANVERALDLVQMRHLADRGASKLSGGQQQRVALARAIAFSPTVVLFDEPLSNLDAKLRAEMRVELRELQRRLDITSVYVTHDQEEALAISDRVIVMNVGRDRADRHAGGHLQSPEEPLRRRLRGLGQSAQGPPRRSRHVRDRGRHDPARRRAAGPRRGRRWRCAPPISISCRIRATTSCPARCASACSTATSCNTSSNARSAA